MKSFITAIQTLSILPIRGEGCDDFSDSLPWFPIVGMILGGILTILAHLCGNMPAEATAALVLLGGVLLTRGFHIDGLADCADGFGGGYTRERVLEIMKDSATGAFGSIAIALSLLIKWVALKHLIESGHLSGILIAYTISRAMQVEQMVHLPYARANGTAASFVRGAQPLHRRLAHLVAGLTALLLGGLIGLKLYLIAWLAAWLFGLYCKKRVGGITGDLLGATSEITEILILFAPMADLGL